MRTKIAVLLLLAALPAAAQELESIAGIRLNFEQPGARALAMGGTLAGNPADLAGAPRAFSIEARRRSTEARYIRDLQLNSIGVTSETDGLTSATVTMPFGRATWSASYDVPLDVARSTMSIADPLRRAGLHVCNGRVSREGCPAPDGDFAFPVTLPIDASLRVQRYATAGAWTSGPLSLGASVRYERLRQQTTLERNVTESIDDGGVTYSAGARWELSDRASIGGAYESGGAFRGHRSFRDVTATPGIELRTPPTLRGGISVDVLPQLTVAADAVRVNYSEMLHDERATLLYAAELGYPDVTEVHAGVEYRAGNVAVRAGWWRDPAHALAIFDGRIPVEPFNYVAAILDGDEEHVTGGIGITRGAVRLDASVDRGTRSTRAAVGLTTRF